MLSRINEEHYLTFNEVLEIEAEHKFRWENRRKIREFKKNRVVVSLRNKLVAEQNRLAAMSIITDEDIKNVG